MESDGETGIAAAPDLTPPVAVRLICHGCGYHLPLDAPRPFRCPNGEARDNIDHVLRRSFDAASYRRWGDARTVFEDPDPNPFRRYRSLLYSYEVARAGGMTDDAYLRVVDRLDDAVRGVDGRGFAATPFAPRAQLSRAVGLAPDHLWVKDETRNVAGSHKARHLMGILIWLAASRQPQEESRLAIASCGNAALAAAVLARAAGRPLDVFVPPDANPHVLDRLRALEAHIEICPRSPDDPPGDPCFRRFLDAWLDGALPFSVQGKRNGLTIEGGCTLAWEMVSDLLASGGGLDHLFVQVGGGALAAACIEALLNARWLGLLPRLPRIHTVQTASAWPLRRAWRALTAEFVEAEDKLAEREPDLATENRRALFVRDRISGERLGNAVDHASQHRDQYMWPWETEPHSIASGILDDETYDWLAVTEGMLATAGLPVVVSEDTLAEAHRLSREHTGVDAEPTGTAGLAGLIELRRAGILDPRETAAVLFTGAERGGRPVNTGRK